MVLAVGEGHGDIDDREPERTPVQILLHAALDRGDVLPRHRATDNGLGELETGAAGQRLDVEMDITELAVAARLLLVAAMLGGRLADGLFVRHLRQPRLDLEIVSVAQPCQGDLKVDLALPPQQHLIGVGVLLEGERRVLLDEFGEGAGEPHLVGPFLGGDRQRVNRLERARPWHDTLRPLARGGEHVAG